MQRAWHRFYQDESGPELLEWVVVTLILILALYALLQAFGPDIQGLIAAVRARFR